VGRSFGFADHAIVAIVIVQGVAQDRRGWKVCAEPDEGTGNQSKVEKTIATKKRSVERKSKIKWSAWGIRVSRLVILWQIHFPKPKS
jgi:hypothetical protein